MFQSDSPPRLFAPVDDHHDLGIAGRQVGSLAELHKVWADLSKRVRFAVDNQKELDVR
jgi:hypothetical protein